MIKYIRVSNYLNRISRLKRQRKTGLLEKRVRVMAPFRPLWSIACSAGGSASEFQIASFGIKLAIKDINWLEDVPGKFVFPSQRMDKIKISSFHNRGVDIKFPWELSRFLFGNSLAAEYVKTGDERCYLTFRALVLDWIKKNPFLYGLNWHCTMDIAIRATNWILAGNAFKEQIENDPDFSESFSAALVEHGMYIETFPEIYKGKHTTNHTVADYLGLLFIACALPDHPASARWKKTAIKGLEECMVYQVYPDGGTFEASSGYHRMVLELFSLAAMLGQQNGLNFSSLYFERLHMMFSFQLSLIGAKGCVARYGDNDSATLLQFDYDKNEDFTYLQVFYKYLYVHSNPDLGLKMRFPFLFLLPEGLKTMNTEHGIEQFTEGLTHHKDSGIVLFKKGGLSGAMFMLPLGQNGRGGHNHFDSGSLYLEYKGKPLLVDPGLHTYLRGLKQRNEFRSYSRHNTIVPIGLDARDFSDSRFFELDPYIEKSAWNISKTGRIGISFKLLTWEHEIHREVEFNSDHCVVRDSTTGDFISRFHFHPLVKIQESGQGYIETDHFTLISENCLSMELMDYDYAGKYQQREASKVAVLKFSDSGSVRMDFHK